MLPFSELTGLATALGGVAPSAGPSSAGLSTTSPTTFVFRSPGATAGTSGMTLGGNSTLLMVGVLAALGIGIYLLVKK